MEKNELKPGPLLATIDSPDDLKNLSQEQLVQLADELRDFILDVTSVHPGHLGSSLGVVELSIALHYVFNTPYDRLIWDVGHQAYPHKILTGRRDVFKTLRQYGGISGFPSRKESPYDTFGTGHASTSVSAALGMAVASALKGEKDRHHIAVIGDGAMTGGMALEGLNNVGDSNANLLLILNDNGISIDKNAGVIKDYLTGMASEKVFELADLKKRIQKSNRRRQEALKKSKSSFLRSSNLFEAFHFTYIGPINGNDVQLLIAVLEEMKKLDGPRLLHIVTTKGKGFEEAEKQQTLYHAPGPFDRHTGALLAKDKENRITYQEVYGRTLLDLARLNDRLVAVTPAMPTGSALTYMRDEFPDRVFDVGIAEQHAVTFSAGLAAEGYTPFCTIYSTFLQRAYDQVIHDVALQNLPVIFGLDRAGLVGSDGPTHHGVFDLAFLNSIPNMTVAAPMDEAELRNLMYTAQRYSQGPFAIRYPRGYGFMDASQWQQPFRKLEIGKGRRIKEGNEVAVLSIGQPGNYALEACSQLETENISAALYDLRFLKPLDLELIDEVFGNFNKIVTVEDGVLNGGLASVISTLAIRKNWKGQQIFLGIPDRFMEHGDKESLYRLCGLEVEGIKRAIIQLHEKN
ncbi:MAG: 1-deoxy-D-xylulose-5-phosphate synthase [Bacteroidales bacterium]|nr:1-deoxy-D-xylulose-5-phosphate synthase [Bacteroidales bacterium]